MQAARPGQRLPVREGQLCRVESGSRRQLLAGVPVPALVGDDAVEDHAVVNGMALDAEQLKAVAEREPKRVTVVGICLDPEGYKMASAWRRAGARPPIPPIWMAIDEKFAKPSRQ